MTASTLDRLAPITGAGLVVSYERISKFTTADDAREITRGVDRQAADADEAAEAKGLGPVVHVADNNRGASRFSTGTREGWDELLALIRDGRVAWVLVWVLDRALRQTRDLDDLLDACRATGAQILQTGTGTVVDPNDPESVALAKIVGVLAEAEVAKMSKRVRRAHAAKAEAGQFHGGARRFGYEPDMSAVREAEAAEIRNAATRVLAGESLRSVTADWNARGVLTATGKAWAPQNLGLMLRRPHLAGLRVHNGTTYPANWPAVLDAATHEALTRFLDNPARRVAPTSGARVHALSGVIRCGVCDTPLYGRPTTNAGGPAYVCRKGQHVQAPTKYVDVLVVREMGARLSRVDASGVFVDPADAERANARAAERAALVGRRKGMPALLATGISPEDYAAGLAAIDAALAALDAEAMAEDDAARLPLRVLDGLTGYPEDEARRLFAALPGDRQRAVIAVLGVPVLGRASRRGRGLTFEPERVTYGPGLVS